MAKWDFTFGIEIECYLPEGGSAATAAQAIEARGVACAAEHYNHQLRDHWKIVTDGSLGDYARGIEVVSPILRGVESLDMVRRVMGALDDYGCTVSVRCGLHVHVGAGTDADLAFFRGLFKLYAHFEPVIDRFMPPSRRQSANMYCRSMTNVALSDVDRAASLDALLNLTTRQAQVQRYHKLNLAAYRVHRTVEFRQHSGTLDAAKAANWIALCLAMVDAAKAGRTITGTIAARQMNTARAGTKTHAVGELILRPEGATAAEAMAATGLGPRINLRHYARACGLAVTTQRTGNETRYFAQAAAASTTAPATLDGMFDLLGCEETEREFFRARTANLSGGVQWAA